jgi:hypothetical protein
LYRDVREPDTDPITLDFKPLVVMSKVAPSARADENHNVMEMRTASDLSIGSPLEKRPTRFKRIEVNSV